MIRGRTKARSVASALASSHWASRARAAFCLVSLALLLPWAARAESPAPTSTARVATPHARPTSPPAPPSSARPDESRQLEAAYGRLPKTFIENKGQENERAKLYLRSGNQTLWLTND